MKMRTLWAQTENFASRQSFHQPKLLGLCEEIRRAGPILVFIVIIIFQTSRADAGRQLILVAPSNSVDTIISEVILREVYRRIDIDVEIRKYPAERALQLANRGKVAGEVQRIEGINKKYTNLIQLRPPINFIEGTVFTKSVTFEVSGWDSLRDYRVGLIRGIKFAERNTQGMNTYAVGDYDRLFHMLAAERFQVAVAPRLNGLYNIQLFKFEGLHDLSPSIMRFDLFHYLHSSQDEIAVRVRPILEAMSAAGEFAAIRRRVIDILLRRAAKQLPPCDDDYRCFE